MNRSCCVVTYGPSLRALIPDPWVLERGFHDVTIVNMEDTAEPAVSEADLSLLWLQWPVTVMQSMIWLHSEVDSICAVAKKRFRHSRLGDCSYCGKWIKCDMHRHVSTFHLDNSIWEVVALPSVVIHRVEGHATGLYGPHPWGTRCAFGHQVGQSRPFLSAMDCPASDLGRCPETMSFGSVA